MPIPTTMTPAQAEISALETSLTTVADAGDRAQALNRLAYLVGQSDLARAVVLAEHAQLRSCRDQEGRLDQKAYAETCVTLGQLLVESAQYERARELASEALPLFEIHRQPDGQLRSMLVSTHAHLGMGNYPQALDLGLTQLELANNLDSTLAKTDTVRHRTESAVKEARLVQDQITELEHLHYAISHDLKGPLLTIRHLPICSIKILPTTTAPGCRAT